MIGAAQEPGLEFFLGYTRLALLMLGASLLLWAAGVYVHAAVGAHTAAVVGGRSLEPWQAAGLAGRRFFLPSLLQALVQQALTGGAVLFLGFAAVPLGVLGGLVRKWATR